MNTVVIKAEIDGSDLNVFKTILEKFKAKNVIVEDKEEKKSLSELVRKADEDYKQGRTVQLDIHNLWESIQ